MKCKGSAAEESRKAWKAQTLLQPLQLQLNFNSPVTNSCPNHSSRTMELMPLFHQPCHFLKTDNTRDISTCFRLLTHATSVANSQYTGLVFPFRMVAALFRKGNANENSEEQER